jgi:hypothetical protein
LEFGQQNERVPIGTSIASAHPLTLHDGDRVIFYSLKHYYSMLKHLLLQYGSPPPNVRSETRYGDDRAQVRAKSRFDKN